MIEHGRFLQSLRRLRRELLKKQQGNPTGNNKHVNSGGAELSTTRGSASLPSLNARRDYFGTAINGEMNTQLALDSKLCSQLFTRSHHQQQVLGPAASTSVRVAVRRHDGTTAVLRRICNLK